MSNGAVLAARRGELGLTIRQASASTRISQHHLEALEADDPRGFAAPVYESGYLKTYARFLGMDPELLTPSAAGRTRRVDLALKLENRHGRRRAVVTGPAVLAAVVVLVAGGLAGYAWRQVVADSHRGAANLGVAMPTPTPAGSPAAAPAVQARPIVLGVHVSDAVWINATIDGQPQYGDQGITLAAGSTVYFTGVDVTLTSGKASATFISIDGRNLGPLGIGVATRHFTSQTSP